MEENLKNISKNILEILDNKTKNLNNINRLILVSSVVGLLLSKLLSSFKINIPGLSTLSISLILIVSGLELLKKHNTTKQKSYLILGSITLGIASLLIGCLVITYPFIIASTILLWLTTWARSKKGIIYDYMEFAEILILIEETFNICFKNYDLEEINTIKQIADIIKEKNEA